MGAGVKKAGAGFFALVAVFAISGMSLGAVVAGAATAPSRGLKITAASVGTRSLLSATRANPIVINPKVKQQLSMTVRNDGTTPVAIRYLRLTGSLLNVHFVRYQATANVNVAPGATRTISVPGDFFDVDGVATGYMNATMQVVDEQRNVLVSQAFVADVQGKVASSVGLLLLEALVFAVVGISEIVIGLARRRLPWNRFMRAVFFALTGASVVVTVVVAAAMSRDALFGSSTWQPAVLIGSDRPRRTRRRGHRHRPGCSRGGRPRERRVPANDRQHAVALVGRPQCGRRVACVGRARGARTTRVGWARTRPVTPAGC
jgi:hypothetical protein